MPLPLLRPAAAAGSASKAAAQARNGDASARARFGKLCEGRRVVRQNSQVSVEEGGW